MHFNLLPFVIFHQIERTGHPSGEEFPPPAGPAEMNDLGRASGFGFNSSSHKHCKFTAGNRSQKKNLKFFAKVQSAVSHFVSPSCSLTLSSVLVHSGVEPPYTQPCHTGFVTGLMSLLQSSFSSSSGWAPWCLPACSKIEYLHPLRQTFADELYLIWWPSCSRCHPCQFALLLLIAHLQKLQMVVHWQMPKGLKKKKPTQRHVSI